jgi:hypothetical protein
MAGLVWSSAERASDAGSSPGGSPAGEHSNLASDPHLASARSTGARRRGGHGGQLAERPAGASLVAGNAGINVGSVPSGTQNGLSMRLFGGSLSSGNGKAVWAVVTRYGCGRGEFFEGCERMGGWRPPPRLWPSSFGSGSEGGNGKSKTLRTSGPEVGCNKPTDATCGGNR